METDDAAAGYHVWAVDNSAYGPIELPTLVDWIRDDRVVAETWLFVARDNGWFKAADVPELNMFFRRCKVANRGPGAGGQEIPPGALRRIKALADMDDAQLAVLLNFVEVVPVHPFTHIVKKGEPGDTMYGVLEGELRSCVTVDGKECLIATLGPGAVFGEISLFDKGPHAADVISNEPSTLVQISASAVTKINKEAPEVALVFLMGLIRAIAGRVRTLTRRYEESVHGAHQKQVLQPG